MDRPAVAIFTNSCPPYRLHVHRRIVQEIPQIKLFSPFTHQHSEFIWATDPSSDIGAVWFGQGEDVTSSHRIIHEWKKGGRMIEWMQQNNIKAVVMAGYNDAGRLRIIHYCHENKIPCFLHADSNILGDSASGIRGIIKKRLVRWVVRNCDAMLVCGTLGSAYFQRYGANPDRIFFYPYEPDYSIIQNIPSEILEKARARFSLNPKRRRIVFSGRLISVKRVDLVIDAFAAIASQRPDWDLVLVGDGVLRKELEARVPKELAARIQWTGFLDDQQMISAIYRLSDVLLLPSDNEPWAVVVNEAAAAGMAIVASHVVGAAAELVRDGVNGHVFRAGNLPDLTRALLDVTDPGKTDALKNNSAEVLKDWQQRGDPINGLRQALQQSNVIKPE